MSKNKKNDKIVPLVVGMVALVIASGTGFGIGHSVGFNSGKVKAEDDIAEKMTARQQSVVGTWGMLNGGRWTNMFTLKEDGTTAKNDSETDYEGAKGLYKENWTIEGNVITVSGHTEIQCKDGKFTYNETDYSAFNEFGQFKQTAREHECNHDSYHILTEYGLSGGKERFDTRVYTKTTTGLINNYGDVFTKVNIEE